MTALFARASAQISRILILAALSFLLMVAAGWPAQSLRLEIEGLEGEVLENVRIALELPPGLGREGKVNPLWLRRFRQGIAGKVARALEPFGYYSPRSEVAQEETAPGQYLLRVSIDPGQPVRVVGRQLEIAGHRHRRLVRRLDDFPLAPGDVLRHDLYEQGKAELRGLAVSLGYLDAGFSRHRIEVEREARSAEVFLTLETGPRYFFGNVEIAGAPDYPERFLRRYLTVRPGEVFSYEKLGKTQQHFLDSDRFRNVIVNPRPDEAENQRVPVTVELEPSSRIRLRPGIGYGTDTEARFTLRYQDVNLFHLGHEFSVDLLAAQLQQKLTANYLIPGYRNIDTLLALRAGYQREDLEAYETQYLFTEVEQIYGFTQGRTGSVFVRYQKENSTVAEDDVRSTFLMPGLRFTQVRYNDPMRPSKGHRFRLEVRGTHVDLLSDVTLLQVLGDGNLLIPLPWRLYLHLRGSAGYSIQNNEIEDVPASLRFFTGGDQSVRGYTYQSLGPKNDAGDTVGGKHLLVGSVELEKRFGAHWGLALFYDAGNAFDSFSDYTLAEAAGLGVRYYSPVGPIRVDLARTVGEPDPSLRLHVGIGLGW